MTRDAALQDLLVSRFSAGELRQLLARLSEGAEMLRALPEGVSLAELVFAMVAALKRRGLVRREFFDALEIERPLLRDEIRKVRARCLNNTLLDRGERWGDGRYELEALYGQGGFGLVWRATDLNTAEYVALKILLEHHSEDPRVLQRFYRGARVLKELSHPGIVQVRSDVQQEGLRYFYVMDLIEGTRLEAMVGVRPHEELLEYVLQIGDALAYIHARGFQHRDVKPGNILVTPRNQAKLIDFDLVTGDNSARLTTRALGTVIYAPPEAYRSESKGPAYDVFSLARTVECMIRGRDPMVADGEASIEMLDAPEPIKAVLRAAVRAEPSQRTNSVAQFCADLRAAWMSGTTERAAAEARTRVEAERVAWEARAREAERVARERAERVAREEAERVAWEARAREEAERDAREEARVACEEAERIVREVRAREEAESVVREEAKRVAREAMEREEAERVALAGGAGPTAQDPENADTKADPRENSRPVAMPAVPPSRPPVSATIPAQREDGGAVSSRVRKVMTTLIALAALTVLVLGLGANLMEDPPAVETAKQVPAPPLLGTGATLKPVEVPPPGPSRTTPPVETAVKTTINDIPRAQEPIPTLDKATATTKIEVPPQELTRARTATRNLGLKETLDAQDALQRIIDEPDRYTSVEATRLVLAELVLMRALTFELAASIEPKTSGDPEHGQYADDLRYGEKLLADVDEGAVEAESLRRVKNLRALVLKLPIETTATNDDEISALFRAAPLWQTKERKLDSGLVPALQGIIDPSTLSQLVLALALLRSDDRKGADALLQSVQERAADQPATPPIASLLKQPPPPPPKKPMKDVARGFLSVINKHCFPKRLAPYTTISVQFTVDMTSGAVLGITLTNFDEKKLKDRNCIADNVDAIRRGTSFAAARGRQPHWEQSYVLKPEK